VQETARRVCDLIDGAQHDVEQHGEAVQHGRPPLLHMDERAPAQGRVLRVGFVGFVVSQKGGRRWRRPEGVDLHQRARVSAASDVAHRPVAEAGSNLVEPPQIRLERGQVLIA